MSSSCAGVAVQQEYRKVGTFSRDRCWRSQSRVLRWGWHRPFPNRRRLCQWERTGTSCTGGLFPPRRMRSVQSLKLFKSSCTQLWTHSGSCDNVLGFSVDLILTCSVVPRPTITANRQSGLCQLWPQVWRCSGWKQHWHQSYHCSRGGWKSDTLDILACNYRQSSSRLMRPGRATYILSIVRTDRQRIVGRRTEFEREALAVSSTMWASIVETFVTTL